MAFTKSFGNEVDLSLPCNHPKHIELSGQHITLLPMQLSHADKLYTSIGGQNQPDLYDYLAYGPFTSLDDFRTHITTQSQSNDPQFYTLASPTTKEMLGQIAYLNIHPSNRKLEIGHIIFSPSLQRTTAATEAIYLLLSAAFKANYRRVEWKANNHNTPSKRAAERLGFVPEGVFRQDMIVKGRNRDSAWFSIVDGREWEVRKAALERWMSGENFDGEGRQKRGLLDLRKEVEDGGRS